MTRSILLVVHTGRPNAVQVARRLAGRLHEAGIELRTLAAESDELDCAPADPAATLATTDDELVIALGGDGTILRAAELVRRSNTPLLGVNLGHVGFLAEAEPVDLDHTVEHVLAREYDVEERLALSVTINRGDQVVATDWALNDVSVEKAPRERVIDLLFEVDGRPVSRWGCDGVVCSTPTGSTAYGFSAGGPVVWPEVQALLAVPLSAHAVFARPLVVSPDATIAIEMTGRTSSAVMFCDGRRLHDVKLGDRLEVRRSEQPVRLVRLRSSPFADRLVEKFHLPVDGWRGPADGD